MANTRLFLTLVLLPLLASGCTGDRPGVAPTALARSSGADAPDPDAPGSHGPLAVPPGPPTAIPFVGTQNFVNPCTGLPDTATITGTLWVHDEARVVRMDNAVITASGFEGRRVGAIVENDGGLFKSSLNAMLVHALGDRLRVHFVLVIDTSSGITRVQQGGGPVCVGA